MNQPLNYTMRHSAICARAFPEETAEISDTMEPEVLPVFYYNDMLLSNIGDTIGLSIATESLPCLKNFGSLECERCSCLDQSFRSTYS